MAAASSTPTPRIRSRTRPRCRISCRCCRSSCSARRSPTCSAAWSATSARAGPFSPRWACCSSPASRVCYWAEANGNADAAARSASTGGNMEGKEVRFGIAASALFAVITTAASCGAVNAMHDSFTALGGMIPLINMQLGEIVVGGVGAGLYGMLLFVILTIFRRRPDGRPHAGICRQEDRGARGQDGDARDPDPAADDARLDGGRGGVSAGGGFDGQCRAARLLRSALRLHLAGGEQRLGLRRAHRQHAVLQPRRCGRDVHRPVLDDHPGDGDRRLAGRQEDASPPPPAPSRPPARCSSACWSA